MNHNPYTLRDLQLFELQILKDVNIVCEENGIRYYLDAGTCLGAVRHKGFIPWDDDIDIAMPCEDYLRFLQIAPKALGDAYFLQTAETDESFHMAYARIRRNGSTMIRPFENKEIGHHGVWLDVFPLLPVGGKLDRTRKKILVSFANMLCMQEAAFQRNRPEIAGIRRTALITIISGIRRLLGAKAPRLAQRIRAKLLRSRPRRYLADLWGNITTFAPSECYEGEPAMLEFEGSLFPCPADWDLALRFWYGDYMTPPPENKRSGGHGEVLVDLRHGWNDSEAKPIPVQYQIPT